MVAVAGAAPTTYVPEVYNAAPETLLEVVRAAPRRRVPAGARAPAGRRRAWRGGSSASGPTDAEFDKFPTGATAVIDFETDGWADLGWEMGRLADFAVPRALE